MHANARKCTPNARTLPEICVHWRALACIGVHLDAFACIGVHWRAFGSICVHWRSFSALLYIGVHLGALACIGVHWRSFACICVHWRAAECIKKKNGIERRFRPSPKDPTLVHKSYARRVASDRRRGSTFSRVDDASTGRLRILSTSSDCRAIVQNGIPVWELTWIGPKSSLTKYLRSSTQMKQILNTNKPL